MRSYRELFRTPEYTPFFFSFAAQNAALTIGGLSLATLVYRATDSPLLSAVSMFGPQLAQMLGATFFLSGADRLPPRVTLTGINLAFAVCTALLALPGLPIGAAFGVVFLQGLIASLGGGVSGGLLNEILPKSGYLLGRSVFNMVSGLMQVVGFATGGALLVLLSPRVCLLLAAALYAIAALGIRLGLTARPPRASGRPSVRATWQTNALLWSSRPRRLTYLGMWLPNGLVVGCESLFVSYDSGSAGALFSCAALGMFVGDLTVGRFLPPALRARMDVPLRILLATPYLLFALRPGMPWVAIAACVASVGFGATLIQQERLMALTPDELAGHALGLRGAGMLTMQGVAAVLAGSVAQLTSPATAMAVMATASISVTVALSAAGRREERRRPVSRVEEESARCAVRRGP
ncbi:MFS transporter [Streptomyces pseudovenezuelae]|uniref:MFS family permease n=1 Tax=Streptomyces pseudovenezuelae TaxID=67350 RepID=A0ABT6LPK7_9ACTN|nr:MFS transporter [Streptomyces pseudovenezuelae]MDH6218235.1 MFS family permease [Streptomyces pseudovenezuelae]